MRPNFRAKGRISTRLMCDEEDPLTLSERLVGHHSSIPCGHSDDRSDRQGVHRSEHRAGSVLTRIPQRCRRSSQAHSGELRYVRGTLDARSCGRGLTASRFLWRRPSASRRPLPRSRARPGSSSLSAKPLLLGRTHLMDQRSIFQRDLLIRSRPSDASRVVASVKVPPSLSDWETWRVWIDAWDGRPTRARDSP